jgi:hypothetical protein
VDSVVTAVVEVDSVEGEVVEGVDVEDVVEGEVE